MRMLKGVAALVITSALSVATHATVTFTSFGSGEPLYLVEAPVGDDSSGGAGTSDFQYLQQFTAGVSGTVTTADIGLIRQGTDDGPFRVTLRQQPGDVVLGFVDTPFANVPGASGTITVDFSSQNIYLMPGNSYELMFSCANPITFNRPSTFLMGIREDLGNGYPPLQESGDSGATFFAPIDSLFFEIEVNVLEPVDPVGFAADSGLRVWHRGPEAVYDVDGPTATASNEVLIADNALVPGFEYADGVYYAGTWGTYTPSPSLRSIDPVTGATNSTVAFSGLPAGHTLVNAFESVGGTMYGLTGDPGAGTLDPHLVTINTATGATASIGLTGMGAPSGGLAYYNGIAYSATAGNSSSASNLFTINLSTGAATLVGPIIDTATGQSLKITGLEYGYDGVLYGLNKISFGTPPDRLYAIDPATGLAFDRGAIGPITLGQLTSLTAVPPAAPVGNGEDPSLVVWERNTPSVFDVDITIPDGVNPVAMTGGGLVAGFEYANGEYVAPDNATLRRFNPDTGALIGSAPITYTPAGNRIHAMESVGGVMYGMVASGASDATLVTVDVSTGVLTDVGATGMGLPSGGLAYYNGTAYSVTAAGQPAQLHTINLATGAATFVAPVIDAVSGTTIDLTGLEFGVDGLLYGLGNFPDEHALFVIDPTTGFAHNLGVMGALAPESTSLSARPVGPAGNGLEPELLLWKSDRGFGTPHTIFDVDVTTPDVFNPVFSLNSLNFTSGAEYANGVIYAPSSEWANPTPMEVVDPATGLVLNTVVLGTPAGVVLKSMEFVNGTMYAARFDANTFNTDLVSVDLSSGVIAPIGPSMFTTGPAGLAYHNGTMYTATGSGNNPSTLYTVDIGTGIATPVGPVIEAGSGDGLALTHIEFGHDGVLYGLGRQTNEDTLFAIDPSSALAYRIGFMPSVGSDSTARATALTSKFNDPELWALGASPAEIYTVDTQTPSLGGVVAPATGTPTAFEHGFGKFYIAECCGGSGLWTVDPGTGASINFVFMAYPPEGNTIKSMEFVGTTMYAGLATNASSGSPSYLARIDIPSGLVNTIGPMGFNGGTGGFAWDGTTMYTVNASGGAATLYTVNLATGAATPIAPVVDSLSGAAVQLTALEFGTDGRLYGMGPQSLSNPLYIVDTVTAAAVQLGNLAPPIGFGASLTANAPCAGDLDGDGDVDGADLGLFLATWGPGFAVTDYDNDGDVDGADLGLFLAQWGPCP